MRCPSRVIVTFNYDECFELAARDAGLNPLPLLPDTAEAFRTPAPGEVAVLHLHGVATQPESLVLPGRTTQALEDNELFMRLLTSLWARHVVVYFGFSFAPTETHLFGALQWLATALPDAHAQRLLLRELEIEERAVELAPLAANPLFRVIAYPDTPEHRAVHQAALILGPTNEPTSDAVTEQAPAPTEHYEPPALLEAEPGADPTGVKADALRAEWGMGGGWVTIPALLASRRALVIAPPGMGKTQLLRAAGRAAVEGYKALVVALKNLPGPLDNVDDHLRAFAHLAIDAAAVDQTTPVPSRARLEDGSYLFLLDALDEVIPSERKAVIDAVCAAAERWPQHAYLVATRPTVETRQLVDRGFTSFRIVASAAWGMRYLARRGIPDERVTELQANAPTAASVLGIPMYAARIGERLAAGESLPDRPIDLLVDSVRALATAEARKQVKPEGAYAAWLQRLAVGLELRGVNEATTAELAELPGPEPGDVELTREQLVRAALLTDVPDTVSFPELTVQEALCADALLSCDDVVAVVRDVAVADLDGDDAFRGDLQHCLDQVWENASLDQRSGLRALDEYRWARTMPMTCAESDAAVALDVIWRWHVERRIWMDYAGQGQLRGPLDAVARIAASHPGVLLARRRELIDATSNTDQPTLRGNAIELLAELERDDDTADWLIPRLDDQNGVVQRHAAAAAAELGVSEALPTVRRVLPTLTDELVADAYAQTLLSLTPDDELGQVAELIYNADAWPRVAEELARRLPLDDAVNVLAAGVGQPDEWRTLLVRTLARHAPESWSQAHVESLAASLVRQDAQPYEDYDSARLVAVVGRHPEAALRGVRDGAAQRAEPLRWTNLFFVERLDRELLRTELDGPLGDAYTLLLERLDASAASGSTPSRQHQRAVQPPPTAQPSSLGRQLDDGEIREDRVPRNVLHWPADGLTADQRDRLAELVEAWWPKAPLRERIVQTDGGVEYNHLALAAVCAGAALDVSLSDERWLDVFDTPGAMSLQREVVVWLRRQHRPTVDEGAAAIIRASSDSWHAYYAVDAFATLTDTVARAFVERIPSLVDRHRFASVVAKVASSGHGHLLNELDESRLDATQLAALREARARAGDLDSQLAIANETVERVRAGEDAPPLGFAANVRDERMVEPLAQLLGLLGPSGGTRDDLQRSVVQALAATRSPAAVRAYDHLMEDRSFEAAFFWYPRTELARLMATDRVLARLPQRVAELPSVVERHGWRPDAG